MQEKISGYSRVQISGYSCYHLHKRWFVTIITVVDELSENRKTRYHHPVNHRIFIRITATAYRINYKYRADWQVANKMPRKYSDSFSISTAIAQKLIEEWKSTDGEILAGASMLEHLPKGLRKV